MIGLGQFKDFEECIEFLKKNKGLLNGIMQIRLFLAPDKICKEYFACDRFESFFDRIDQSFDLDFIKEIFNEPFAEIEISYKLMPCGKRNYPLVVKTRTSKQMLQEAKNLNINIVAKTVESLYKELLHALVEGK